MPVTLYRRQKQIYEFILQYIQKYTFSPTLQEIADAMGLSSLATVHEHLAAMEKKGVIRRYTGSVRGIELVDYDSAESKGVLELPIMGFIAAGSPIEPLTDPNETQGISPSMVSGKNRSYILQVKGDSMIDDGILDGDFVVVEQVKNVNNGDIVVALLKNGLATLKRYFKETTRVRLEPANSKMAPIYAREVTIQGKVVGVIRRY